MLTPSEAVAHVRALLLMPMSVGVWDNEARMAPYLTEARTIRGIEHAHCWYEDAMVVEDEAGHDQVLPPLVMVQCPALFGGVLAYTFPLDDLEQTMPDVLHASFLLAWVRAHERAAPQVVEEREVR